MIRPGRLDHPLFVALPTPEDRVEILTALTRKTPLSHDVDLQRIAMDERAANFRYLISLETC
jgi:ribosome biogenesis ATPase